MSILAISILIIYLFIYSMELPNDSLFDGCLLDFI